MTHHNAPLTPEGRRRLCERIDAGRPISHVADEGGISRPALTKWYKRWLAYGEDGLQDRTSRPEHSPTATPSDIHRCLTDNGPAYKSKVFNAALAGTGTTHKYTRPHTPRTNGKVERFNLTMKLEWLYKRAYASEEERRDALAPFLNEYNHDRPHSSLGNKPPASRVPVRTYRMEPQPEVLEVPLVEGMGHEPTLFDLL